MDRSREVLITGLGIVSPIGIGRDAFWASLQEGRSGVAPVRTFPTALLPVKFCAELKDFDAKQYVKPRKALKVMCRDLQIGFSAYALAAADAAHIPGQLSADRIGTLFGSDMMYGEIDDFTDLYRLCAPDNKFSFAEYAAHFQSRMYPLWMLKNLPNMAACHVAIAQDAQGPCNTICSGDISSLLALIEGTRLIERGILDVAVVGGTGNRVNLISWMFRGCSHLSSRNDDPAAASRPFDRNRDGMVNGEGAATFILEAREHAERRGAQVLGRIRGTSHGMDTQRTQASRQTALGRVMRNALQDAHMEAGQVGHINAHGLSTVEDDRNEAAAIAEVFDLTPVTALKSYFGNIGAGSGLLELAGSVLAIEQGVIPTTLNYTHPDPSCPIRVVHGQPMSGRPPSVLKLGFSPAGQVAAVIIDH